MSIAHVSSSSNALIGRERHGGLQTAGASEWLVKTGLGVKNMEIGRTFYQWPGQKICAVDMKPRNISFSLHRSKSLSYDRLCLISPHVPWRYFGVVFYGDAHSS